LFRRHRLEATCLCAPAYAVRPTQSSFPTKFEHLYKACPSLGRHARQPIRDGPFAFRSRSQKAASCASLTCNTLGLRTERFANGSMWSGPHARPTALTVRAASQACVLARTQGAHARNRNAPRHVDHCSGERLWGPEEQGQGTACAGGEAGASCTGARRLVRLAPWHHQAPPHARCLNARMGFPCDYDCSTGRPLASKPWNYPQVRMGLGVRVVATAACLLERGSSGCLRQALQFRPEPSPRDCMLLQALWIRGKHQR
jgi:hypothetical protein